MGFDAESHESLFINQAKNHEKVIRCTLPNGEWVEYAYIDLIGEWRKMAESFDQSKPVEESQVVGKMYGCDPDVTLVELDESLFRGGDQ